MLVYELLLIFYEICVKFSTLCVILCSSYRMRESHVRYVRFGRSGYISIELYMHCLCAGSSV